MSKAKPPLLVIAGPTASGKSAFALFVAQQIGGVIVNADSAQIYSDLPQLSAIPTKREMEQADHRLYAVRDGAAPCSAADWASMARREVADIHDQGRTPILAGGTGLYLRTLLEGIAPVPPIDPEVRAHVRTAAPGENRAQLEALDPQAASRLNAGDSARISRALEVVLSTKRTIGEWQTKRTGGIGDQVETGAMILLPPRRWLYQRCDERFAQMVRKGATDEVKALLARELDPNLPVMRAIGVRELARFLSGKTSLEEAVAAGQQATRRYAKRQYTWFAHQPPPDWPRFHEPLEPSRMRDLLAPLGARR